MPRHTSDYAVAGQPEFADEETFGADDRTAGTQNDAAGDFSIKKILTLCSFMGAGLVLLEYPYNSIHTPPAVMLALAFCSALFMLYVTFEVPYLLLPILVTFVPFSKILQGDFGGTLTAFNLLNMMLVGIAVAHCWRYVYYQDKVYRPTPIDRIFLIFILISSVSFIRIVYVQEGLFACLTDYKRYATPWILFFLVCSYIRTKQEIRLIAVLIPIIFVMVCIFSAKKYFIDHQGFRSEGWIRLAGVCGQPNNMGGFLVYYGFILLAFGFMRGAGFWIRISSILTGVLLTGKCLLGTASRGAQAAYVFAVMTFFFFRNKLIFIILFFAASIVVVNPDMFPEFLVGRWRPIIAAWREGDDVGRADKSGESRRDLSLAAVRMANENMMTMMFGVGYRQYRNHIWTYLPTTTVSDSHNQFAQILAEMGYPGLLFFCLTFFGIIYYTWKVIKWENDEIIRTFAWGFFAGQVGAILVNLSGCRLESMELVGWYWICAAAIMRRYVMLADEHEDKIEHREVRVIGADDYFAI